MDPAYSLIEKIWLITFEKEIQELADRFLLLFVYSCYTTYAFSSNRLCTIAGVVAQAIDNWVEYSMLRTRTMVLRPETSPKRAHGMPHLHGHHFFPKTTVRLNSCTSYMVL